MRELDGYRGAMHSLPAGAAAAEAEAEKEDSLCVTSTGGVPSGASASSLTELFIRATGASSGMAYTQDLAEDPALVIRRAWENSRCSSSGPAEMNPESWEGENEAELRHSKIGLLREAAAGLERDISGVFGKVSFSRIIVTETVRTVGLVNSLGRDMASSRRRLLAQALFVREEEGKSRVFDEQLTARTPEGLGPEYFFRRLAAWEEARLPAGGLAPGEYRAVLDASVTCNILATAWQMFAAPFHLSGGTPLAGRLGETVFTPSVNIADLPDSPATGFSFAFDCEGTACAAVSAVKDGVLTGLLHTLASAKQMGAAPTGNAGRKTLLSGSVHTRTAAMPRNFAILPGAASRHDLFAMLGDGVYVSESYDVFHSINIASGAFAIPCKAVSVRGGKAVSIAEGVTINGTVQDLFARVLAAADDTAALPMAILNSYAVAAPSLLVSRLQVSG